LGAYELDDVQKRRGGGAYGRVYMGGGGHIDKEARIGGEEGGGEELGMICKGNLWCI
jgi:hypothetical protein